MLEIDHNGQVTEGLNANGAPTVCLLNGSLMAFNSIRIKADVDHNENTWPLSAGQRQGLVKILFLTNNQLILVHLGCKVVTVVNHIIRLCSQTKISSYG